MKWRFHNHLTLSLLFLAMTMAAFGPPDKTRYKKSGNGWRLHFGSGLNFYNINDKHGDDPRQRLNATLGFRREIKVVRDYKTFLLIGADYIMHGMSYKSYYFKPDSVKLYDRKYNYLYDLNINEFHVPIEIKYLLRRADNSLFSPYLLAGYHLRYMLPVKVVVTRNGEQYADEREEMKFRTHLFGERINASLALGAGWQKNRLGNSHGSFFMEFNFQYGFSDYYFNSGFSAESMFINCIQATLLMGAKF